MVDVSIVIPFLNEEENLPDLVAKLNEYAKTQSFSMEAVLVDDGSTDSSVDVLKSLVSETVPLKLVCLSKNFGSHAALRAGISEATGKYTMFFPADLQDPFSMINEMYDKASEGFDIVIACTMKSKVSLYERKTSSFYSFLMRKFVSRDYPRHSVRNLLFNEKVKKVVTCNVESSSSLHMQIINMGFRQAIVGVSVEKRNKGKSKWTFSKKFKIFLDSFLGFSYLPIRFITVFGILAACFGVLFAIWVFIAKVTGFHDYESGFPTIFSVLLIGFGMTNFAIGISAEYIWRTLEVARNRPVFIIDSVETLSGKSRSEEGK